VVPREQDRKPGPFPVAATGQNENYLRSARTTWQPF
jgi:hypothetical protein